MSGKELAIASDADGLPAIYKMDQAKALAVLTASHYPGAKPESVALVLDYCRAAKLDPMLKPVHIVPMKVATGEKDKYGNDVKEMRDVIMPGVGLYRTQAARNPQAAGMSAPEFGPDKVLKYQDAEWYDDEGRRKKRTIDMEMKYPEWCKVVVYKKMADGSLAEYPAIEFFTECCATKNNGAPNAMWAKRPRGQLIKCTESQALRKAFPENGAAPTAEEMQGKELDDAGGDVIDHDTGEVLSRNRGDDLKPKSKSAKHADATDAEVVDQDKETKHDGSAKTSTEDKPDTDEKPETENKPLVDKDAPKVSKGMLATMRHKLTLQKQFTEESLCKSYGLDKLDDMPAKHINDVLTVLTDAANNA